MPYAQIILPEFDQEMQSTRKVLERVPDDKLDWKPHARSRTIGWNANHLADLPEWGVTTLTQDQFDFAPVGGKRYEMPSFRTRREILDHYDRGVAALRKAIEGVRDDDLARNWTLLSGGNVIFSAPRAAVMRSFVFNHMIHHRAVLRVYLRLNDIPVPGMYGPSGDEELLSKEQS
jgi:uncharacterized damage-inducible protein DinB